MAEHPSDWDHFLLPLAFFYNNQVYFLAGAKAFSLVLLSHLPGLAVLDLQLSMPSDVLTLPNPKIFCKHIWRKLEALQTYYVPSIAKRLRTLQGLVWLVRSRLATVPMSSICICRSSAWPLTPAIRPAHEPPSNLQLKNVGSFGIIITTPEITAIDEDGINNTVSTDRATRALEETDETNKTDKTRIRKKCVSLHSLNVYGMTDPTKPETMVQGLLGAKELIKTFDVSSVGTSISQLTIRKNSPSHLAGLYYQHWLHQHGWEQLLQLTKMISYYKNEEEKYWMMLGRLILEPINQGKKIRFTITG